MEWQNLFAKNIVDGGRQYIEKGAVKNLRISEDLIEGDVSGLDNFHVKIQLSGDAVEQMECSCPFAKAGKNCKHMSAILLSYDLEGEQNSSDLPEKQADSLEPTSIVKSNNFALDHEITTDDSKMVDSSDRHKLNIDESIKNIESAVEIESEPNEEKQGDNSSEVYSESKDWPYHEHHDGRIEIKAEITKIFSYSLYQNGQLLIDKITIENTSDEDLRNIVIRAYSDYTFFEMENYKIETLSKGDVFGIRGPKIYIRGDKIKDISDKVTCNIYVCATSGEEEIGRFCEEIEVLTLNQWPGLYYKKSLLASYVIPNLPEINDIILSASDYLNNYTNDPSMDGYQSGDEKRTYAMANAMYAAIQKKNIVYAEPPAGFIYDGQKVRLIDEILSKHMGTCLDMSLLYAACLEQIGLNPILILLKGHIFTGVWRKDEHFPAPCIEDFSKLDNALKRGKLILVECTAMCSGTGVDFEQAVKTAESNVIDDGKFECVVDIRRSRKGNIRPVPIDTLFTDGQEVEHKELNDTDITGLSEDDNEILLVDDFEKETITKRLQWEHRLLDLSIRNPLINIPKKTIAILATDIGRIEDALADKIDYKLTMIPEELDKNVDAFYEEHELRCDLSIKDLIRSDIEKHILHTAISLKNYNKEITKLYRTTKNSISENGANTLYLVMGELKWTEKKSQASKYYYAPLVLIPIEIVRKSAIEGYVIRGTDDETLVNTTLLEFLKQKFGVIIPGMNPIPTDEHGVDIKKIFAIVRESIKNYDWTLLDNVYIGNFSFSQFVMWSDMHNHPEMLQRSPVVAALMDNECKWNACLTLEDEKTYLPVSVDSSQLKAINMAAGGTSFVLHGPPGAGKSQTITAMITNILARGKTVLFVAEKKPALDVVQNRLESIGIGDFCLELHSNKMKKQDVLDKLQRVRDNYPYSPFPTKFEELDKKRKTKEKDLDEYGLALHKERPFGMSVRELIDRYESISHDIPRIHLPKAYLAKVTKSETEEATKRIGKLIDAGKVLGNPAESPFKNVRQTEYSMLFARKLEETFEKYNDTICGLRRDVADFIELIEKKEPVRRSEWLEILGISDALINAGSLPEYLYQPNIIDNTRNILENYIEKRDDYFTIKKIFFARYKESILNIDINEYKSKYSEAEKRIFGKEKAIAAVTDDLCTHTVFRAGKEFLDTISDDISAYNETLKAYETAKMSIPDYCKSIVTDEFNDDDLDSLLERWSGLICSGGKYSQEINSIHQKSNLQDIESQAKKVNDTRKKFEKTENELFDMLLMKRIEGEEDWLTPKEQFIELYKKEGYQLQNWIRFREAMEACLSIELNEICDKYINGAAKADDLIPMYLKSIYYELIWQAISEEEVLNKFSGHDFETRVREYKELDEQLQKETLNEVIHVLTRNIPTEDSIYSKELKFLNKSIASGGKGRTIRDLFDKMPNAIRRMCPCFLMSPLSVAQYLAPDCEMFDVVIFDEASQIRTCEAVGTLSRGRNAVIVGDEKQMPPTSFFASDTFDEDNIEIEDLDSILDDCLALGMPETHLKWHYRSRHESLIYFSNHEFYDDKMYTFPSVNDRERRVKLCTLNGVFGAGKDRTNEKEAKAIVSEILRRYHDDNLKKYSIGVVTFNKPQQELIDKLLDDEQKKDIDFDNWVENSNEPLIVRNLENIQGDERDIILFSVTYGMDEDRRWRQDFGPLNKVGGWRRLNVAVSRARYEMIVYTSISASMIKNPNSSKEIKGIQDFMTYAEYGIQDLDKSSNETTDIHGIAKSIEAFICNKGYKVQRNVGKSVFKIDLAVVNPEDENEYLMGILLDGDSYKASLDSTKDRELSQESVLRGLGWDIYRVWTMDWWANRQSVLNGILNHIQSRIAEEKARGGKNSDFDYFPESEELDEVNTTKKENKGKISRGATKVFKELVNPVAPYAAVFEEKIYSKPEGDFFKRYKIKVYPITMSVFDSRACYYLRPDDGGERLIFLLDETELIEKMKKEKVPAEDLAKLFHAEYEIIPEEEFVKAIKQCMNDDLVRMRFKSIRNSLPVVEVKEDEK